MWNIALQHTKINRTCGQNNWDISSLKSTYAHTIIIIKKYKTIWKFFALLSINSVTLIRAKHLKITKFVRELWTWQCNMHSRLTRQIAILELECSYSTELIIRQIYEGIEICNIEKVLFKILQFTWKGISRRYFV